ncbi:hypothetical protein O181_025549 [Austropuccinia psidii MF-1]|uniref:Uncharacterized protein n=1 Tax=Austropuccinia psidii MF-1 TaxID=1389203 RepID=A0A9Q3CI97_9BASI|nr:hypothetical protein [Austropuccinia psidii MF-1]
MFHSILINSGATNSFIEKNSVLKYSLTITLFITQYTKCVAYLPSSPSFEWEIPLRDFPKGEDPILGYHFLYDFNPIIDCKNGLIPYDSSNKDSSGIKSSASNSLATAVNSVALVGEIKTPYLPSSVYIPSIKPSQSLLQSRDEVFKEIKYVGEDVAISSLHLFQGDMDLPPLSFIPPWRSSGMRRKSQKKFKLC